MQKKQGYLGVKLDFNKAYDQMEWCFLEKVLKAFRFNDQATRHVMQCVTTVQFTLLLNGRIHSNVTPSRGLRQ